MKKIIAFAALLFCLSVPARAGSVLGDLINYANYTSTFTKIVDVGELTSFSLEIVNSSSTQPTAVLADSSKISVGDDTIASTATFGLGQQILLTGTAPTGLTAATTYYAIPISDTLMKLALTSTGAVAGLAVDITAVSTSTVVTLTPLSYLVGAAGMTWAGSNDGVNFVTTGSSVTLTTTGVQLRDFGAYAYKYLQINSSGVTTGTMKLRAYINGRRAV